MLHARNLTDRGAVQGSILIGEQTHYYGVEARALMRAALSQCALVLESEMGEHAAGGSVIFRYINPNTV